MADIALRAYVKEIDDLIEREKLDEAIAHCRHILQIYPKHLGTYRLLGKAYLEAKRYGDAADIFQRVLSAVPDDFVSHVGMAIVREDEGNLDAAIWHMERAFETNPANPAIRQELSRLIGRRDGLEPHKVRLTRGALARQYAQGELFPQAISELRSALQEDPDRPDLEVLLASMYWRAGQAKEAKSVCEQILEKLPFSLEANRILSDLLEKEGQSQRAGELHRKLAALDPYIGFLESVDLEPETVDANAVRVDHSTWSPGEPLPTAETGPPEWVTSLGVDLSSDAVSSSPKPAWLSDLDQSPAGGRSSTSPLIEPAFDSGEFEGALQDEDAIPEWMREAGWGPSSGDVEEGPVSFSDDELESLDSGNIPAPPTLDETGELAPADIPSWLQDIAPPAGTQAEDEADEASPAALPPTEPLEAGIVPEWLSETAGHQAVESDPEAEFQAVEGGDESTPDPVSDQEGPEVPTWMDSQSPGATSTIISWLGDREDEDTDADEADAIEDLAAGLDVDGSGDLEDFPSWLQDAAENLPDGGDEQEEDIEIEGPPSWLAGVAEAASSIQSGVQPEGSQAPPASADQDAGYAETDTSGDTELWIRRLAEQEEVAAETLPEQGPDWLSGIGSEPEEDEGGAPVAAPSWLSGTETRESAEPTSATESNLEAPDWLDGVEEVPPEEPAEQVDVPEWLMGIAEGTGARPSEPTEDEDEDRTGEFAYDWLGQFGGEDTAAADQSQPAEELREVQTPDPETSETDSSLPIGDVTQTPAAGQDLDDDEVFQWLESLAEQQQVTPADTKTQAVEPDRTTATDVPYSSEAPPDAPDESLRWLEDLAAERGIDVDVGASPEPMPVLPEAPESSPPASQPLEAVSEPDPAFETEGSQETPPDWLHEMAASDQTAAEGPGGDDESRPAFTPDMDETVISQPAEPQADEVIPGWLDEAAAVAQDVPAEPSSSAERPLDEPVIPAVEHAPEPPPTPDQVFQATPPPAPAEAMSGVEEAAPKLDKAPIEAEQPGAKIPVSEQLPPAPPAEEKPQPETKQPPGPQQVYKEPPTDAQMLLKSARQALAAGDAGRALSDYKKMIERKQDLETVISDLKRALERYPNLATLWQSLGDAYMKDDQLNEAIKAYQRGMEVA